MATNTIIAITNNKGGAGKTTSTRHLAKALRSQTDEQITVIDLDGQGNLTDAILRTKPANRPHPNIGHLLQAKAKYQDCIKFSEHDRVNIIPSDGNLDDVADDMALKPLEIMRLRTILSNVSAGGITLIDCPPNLGVLTYSALIAADYLLIPAKPEMSSINGVDRVLSKVREVDIALHRSPHMLGCIITQVRDTVEHRDNIQFMHDSDIEILGIIPVRGGQNADNELLAAYMPIAGAILSQIGAKP